MALSAVSTISAFFLVFTLFSAFLFGTSNLASRLRKQLGRKHGKRLTRDEMVLPTKSDWMMIGLLVSDLVQASGGIMSWLWLSTPIGSDSSMVYCTVQGTLLATASLSSVLWSTAICLVAISNVFRNEKNDASSPLWITLTIVVCILFPIAITSFSWAYSSEAFGVNGQVKFYCFISQELRIQRFTFNYLWILLAILVIAVGYSVLIVKILSLGSDSKLGDVGRYKRFARIAKRLAFVR